MSNIIDSLNKLEPGVAFFLLFLFAAATVAVNITYDNVITPPTSEFEEIILACNNVCGDDGVQEVTEIVCRCDD